MSGHGRVFSSFSEARFESAGGAWHFVRIIAANRVGVPPWLSQPVAFFLTPLLFASQALRVRREDGLSLWLLYSIEFIVYNGAMISQKARYALRALLYLAAKSD